MKKILILLALPLIILISCKGKNSYTVETYYSENKSNGDTTMVTKKDVITAESDSAAYIKAQDKFNTLMSKSGNDNGMPVKFVIRNYKDVIVIQPGMDTNIKKEETMYPNQRPTTDQ